MDVSLFVLVRSMTLFVGLLVWASWLAAWAGEALAWVVELVLVVLLPR